MGRSSGWDDYRLTCMHGVREGLDSHDCGSCLVLAQEMGEDTANGRTYLYRKAPRRAMAAPPAAVAVPGGSHA